MLHNFPQTHLFFHYHHHAISNLWILFSYIYTTQMTRFILAEIHFNVYLNLITCIQQLLSKRSNNFHSNLLRLSPFPYFTGTLYIYFTLSMLLVNSCFLPFTFQDEIMCAIKQPILHHICLKKWVFFFTKATTGNGLNMQERQCIFKGVQERQCTDSDNKLKRKHPT